MSAKTVVSEKSKLEIGVLIGSAGILTTIIGGAISYLVGSATVKADVSHMKQEMVTFRAENREALQHYIEINRKIGNIEGILLEM